MRAVHHSLDHGEEPVEREPSVDRRPILRTGAHRTLLDLDLVLAQVLLRHLLDGKGEGDSDEKRRDDDGVELKKEVAERDDWVVRDGREKGELVERRQQDEDTSASRGVKSVSESHQVTANTTDAS